MGSFLGENAFAAMNLAIPFVLINLSFADLIGVGSAVPISLALGKNQKEEANNYFTCACLAIVLLGAATGAILYAASPVILWAMGAEESLQSLEQHIYGHMQFFPHLRLSCLQRIIFCVSAEKSKAVWR